ncbi:hypothetical protein E2C01_025752 [Portunus trituberculatus]|uniref:Uncharacterized protein n=1 Tax=Portunus trituberculatus TaxID=210409 RepID=A0A5B7EE35_PORTR|nr:hypothetical protein [Portunus trituberculatus]
MVWDQGCNVLWSSSQFSGKEAVVAGQLTCRAATGQSPGSVLNLLLVVDTERVDYRPGVSLPHEGRVEAESETLLYLYLILVFVNSFKKVQKSPESGSRESGSLVVRDTYTTFVFPRDQGLGLRHTREITGGSAQARWNTGWSSSSNTDKRDAAREDKA